MASSLGTMVKNGAVVLPAGMVTLTPAIASVTLTVWVLPLASVKTIVSMSAANAPPMPPGKLSLAMTVVALSVVPVWLMVKTIASFIAPSMALLSVAWMLTTGIAFPASVMVPVPLTPPMVTVVVSGFSRVLSVKLG